MRKQYSKSDIKAFLETHSFAKDVMTKKSSVARENDCLFVNGELSFLCFGGVWCPSLQLLLKQPAILPHVVVDKGAIKFVVNGADVMRPGIVRVDFFEQGAIVVVVDEGYGKPLAVGKALVNSQELSELRSGKVVRLLHHIGDEYWKQS